MSYIEEHYTYEIRNVCIWKKYLGVRSCLGDPTEDIGVKYFSSSSDKEFIKDQKKNPQDYEYSIIGLFDTRKEAEQHEIEMHLFYDVANNKNFYNIIQQREDGTFSGGSGANHTGAKTILQIDISTGEIIKKWSCAKEAIHVLKITSISSCARREILQAGGFVWVYPKEYTPERKQEIIDADYNQGKKILQVNQYNGKIIKEWGSAKEAADVLGISKSHIGQCVRRNRNISYNFIWEFPENYTTERKQEIIDTDYTKGKRILQINKDTNIVIKLWSSQKEASASLGISSCGINNCLAGRAKTGGGFKWELD